ncbi:MAG: glycoside hydrolase family 3 N-terminal domain-containing protein [Thermoleophilia bacterium]
MATLPGVACGAGQPPPGPAQLAGQRVVYPFAGTTVPSWLRDRIRRGEAGAVLLFAGNGTDAAAVRRLTDELQAIPRPAAFDAPLLVMTDQEGGPVRRLTGAPEAGAGRLSARPVAASRAAGDGAGRLLCRAGVNVNLAPVVDLARPGSVIAAQGRSFGRSPVQVARRAVAFALGMAPWGVLAAPKHFPGLGPAIRTTDDIAVTLTTPGAELRRADERPYRALIARGVPLVMVGTAGYRAFGPRPAALNPRVVEGELRERLGFEGVVVSDALDTPALEASGDHGTVAVLAAGAGVDLLLYADPAAARAAADGIALGLRDGTVSEARARASLERVLSLRRALDGSGPSMSGPLAARPPAPGRPAC